jgi:hypothetical protein
MSDRARAVLQVARNPSTATIGESSLTSTLHAAGRHTAQRAVPKGPMKLRSASCSLERSMSYAAREIIENQAEDEAERLDPKSVEEERVTEEDPEDKRAPDDDSWLYECSITAD